MTFKDYANAIKTGQIDDNTALLHAMKAGKGSLTYCMKAINHYL